MSSNVEISESDHFKTMQDNDDNEIGETYEDRGYSKLPLDQINLNTEPISINNEFSHSLFDNNIKSYIKVFLGFIVFIIVLFVISILSGHFHYEKVDTDEKEFSENQNIKNNLKTFQSVNNQDLNERLIYNSSINNNTIDKNMKTYILFYFIYIININILNI